MQKKIIILILMAVGCVDASRILALMVVPSNSHHFWNSKYLEALAERGHHVTYLTVNEYKNPPKNVRTLHVKGTYEALYEEKDLTEMCRSGAYWNTYVLEEWDDEASRFEMGSEALRRLRGVVQKEKFDLVVHDLAAGAYLLGAVDVLGRPPVIGITPFGVPTWALNILGNPMSYASKPYFQAPYSNEMTILERADNYLVHLFYCVVRWYFMKRQNEYARMIFGKDIRSLEEISEDINIIMVNSNYGIDYPFPMVPGLIPVGGLHIAKPKLLPQDLQSYLDNATQGVIYFSLGSVIRGTALKKKSLQILKAAFKEMAPVEILWKWDSDDLTGKPDNVKIEKWLPQNDILAHPNVRLFFTHSGMLSTQEAIYHGKPVVGMPFFLDQHLNLKKCVERGFGEQLEYHKITVETVVTTLRKVFYHSNYTENVRKASVIFRDNLNEPMERAVYWTEYAIRHKGARHLRHSARNLSSFQNWMLDVLLIFFLILFTALLVIFKLCIACVNLIGGNHYVKLKKN